MSKVLKARLENGQAIEYLAEIAGSGQMKHVHFTPDRSAVVCFFKDKDASKDPERRRRLQAIVGQYNPTTDPGAGGYWSDLFCWPSGVVTAPELGIVAPAYAAGFFFGTGPFRGKEKQSTWFTSAKLRRMIPDEELGSLRSYLEISIRVARAIRRMHGAGLAHSDLSNKNVLIDPTSGRAAVIDIDSLVVPQMYAPDVLGTPGYIAPEVLATQAKQITDPARVLPSRTTDQHALAVLLYQYLLHRHPLQGPKVRDATDEAKDELLSMGSGALWIENPKDRSNWPARPPAQSYQVLGPHLAPLFERAFMGGLHNPAQRPGADEWERALERTLDLLVPCGNASCSHKWFIFDESRGLTCPFCNWQFRGTIPVLNFYRDSGRGGGQYKAEGYRFVGGIDRTLHAWHFFSNRYPGERADGSPLASFVQQNGRWKLVNQNGTSMQIVGGAQVPPRGSVDLTDGVQLLLSREDKGRVAHVQIVRV
jgi:hypothetical protein